VRSCHSRITFPPSVNTAEKEKGIWEKERKREQEEKRIKNGDKNRNHGDRILISDCAAHRYLMGRFPIQGFYVPVLSLIASYLY
jgi:hypothetical protein